MPSVHLLISPGSIASTPSLPPPLPLCRQRLQRVSAVRGRQVRDSHFTIDLQTRERANHVRCAGSCDRGEQHVQMLQRRHDLELLQPLVGDGRPAEGERLQIRQYRDVRQPSVRDPGIRQIQLPKLRKLLEAAKPGIRDRNAPEAKTLQPRQAAERAGCPPKRGVVKAPTINKRHICSAGGENDPAAPPFHFAYRPPPPRPPPPGAPATHPPQ